jgi:endonuclease III
VASRTYSELVQHGITTPEAIQQAGWDRLVEILDQGHYVRYDYSTADKLLDVSAAVKEHGSFGNFLHECKDVEDVSSHLQEIKGVGPKTVEIFLRDMAPLLRENSPLE